MKTVLDINNIHRSAKPSKPPAYRCGGPPHADITALLSCGVGTLVVGSLGPVGFVAGALYGYNFFMYLMCLVELGFRGVWRPGQSFGLFAMFFQLRLSSFCSVAAHCPAG